MKYEKHERIFPFFLSSSLSGSAPAKAWQVKGVKIDNRVSRFAEGVQFQHGGFVAQIRGAFLKTIVS